MFTGERVKVVYFGTSHPLSQLWPVSPLWDSTAQGAVQGPVNQRDKEVGPNQKYQFTPVG